MHSVCQEEGYGEFDESIHVLLKKWELYADGSPAYHDFLFGENEEIPDGDTFPEWCKQSVVYYQNDEKNREDMKLTPFQLYDKLRQVTSLNDREITVKQSMMVLEKNLIENVNDRAVIEFLYK